MPEKKAKRINWVLTNENDEASLHGMLKAERRREHHRPSGDCEIAVLWMLNQQADTDGRINNWKVSKCSESDTALHDFDFKIGINKSWWEGSNVEARAFALDSAMCEIQPSYDADGEQKVDENERPIWRKRKPDFAGFEAPVKDHGPQTEELASAGRALASAQTTLPFVAKPEPVEDTAPN